MINRLIIAYCEKYELQDFPFGQTRLKAWGQAGREPDIAYAFNRDNDLPGLVVEVVFSSGDEATLKSSYEIIGITELWIWKDNQITFYSLQQGNYITVESSCLLTKIESKSFVEYVNRGMTESPSIIKKDFLTII